MKAKITLISLFFTLLMTSGFAQITVKGHLVNQKSEPIEYANVVLQSGSAFHGTISDESGHFSLQAATGGYALKISVIGYEVYEDTLDVHGDTNLGEIKLEELTVRMDEVVVKAERIVRSADRFIVNLANDPTVFGKTGNDMLNLSPGVFVQERDGTISINGKTGTRVYVNERPLHETGTDLVRYLQTLRAEDILRIEVLPTAGAEYDASITGGVIKIMLKRQRNDGINGSIGASYAFAPDEDAYTLSPSYTMNYKNNKLSMYTMINFDQNRIIEHVDEDTWNGERHVHSVFDFPVRNQAWQVRLGGIYELSEKQSIGVEGYFSPNTRKNKSRANLTETNGLNQTDITSFYHGKNSRDSYSASANYILTLDDKGSLFKVLLDYYHNKSDDSQNYNSRFQGYLEYDSVYRSNMLTTNDLYSVNTDLSLRVNEYSSFSTGMKYTRNEMDNDVLFEFQKANAWHTNEPYSSESRFTEDIAALYALFYSKINKISYSIGLRGEFTYASPTGNKTGKIEDQHYFKLFPSANIMYPLGERHSIVLNYNRTISRPSFSQLNPFRLPASEYLYVEGNPQLKPALSNDYSVSLRLFNRHNLSIGFTDTKDAVGTMIVMDPENSDVLIQRMDNVERRKNYYVSFNTYFNPVNWWQVYMNLSGSRNELDLFDEKRSVNTFRGYLSFQFYLPKSFMFDLNGFYMSPFIGGNIKTKVDPEINLSIRRQFFDNKLSTRLFVNNLLDKGTAKVTSDEKDFRRILYSHYSFRQLGISLTYNFQVGKKVQVKNVEAGAVEERARLK